MASHVVVLSSDLKRTTVKVNPGTYLIDVLEEACKKLNLSSDKFLLKHKQKQVELAIPFRASGLSPGAKLELVQKSKTPSAIQVALQVPLPEGKEIPGGRLISKFPSDLTIWKLLRQFESGKASNGRNINITARSVASTTTGSGQLFYEMPVLNIMGRELSSFAGFQKTLSQLGYNSGSVLLRLSYRQTEQTLYDAMTEISQYFKDAEEESNLQGQKEDTNDAAVSEKATSLDKKPGVSDPIAANPPLEPGSSATDNKQSEDTKVEPPQQADAMEVDESQPEDPLRPVNVFLAPSNSTPAAALSNVDEADYMPTIAHAQLHQAQLQERSKNKRLLSDRELEEKAAAEQAKINAVQSVLVKVRFPDTTSSEWRVRSSETGQFLYQAVRGVMASSEQPFRLVISGTKTTITDDGSPKNSLIKGYKISGPVLVNLVWDDSVPPKTRSQPFLKSEFAQRGQEVKVPEPVQPVEKDDGKGAAASHQVKAESSETGGEKVAKKIPKWLKLGKK